jgi:hypothetical protein
MVGWEETLEIATVAMMCSLKCATASYDLAMTRSYPGIAVDLQDWAQNSHSETRPA